MSEKKLWSEKSEREKDDEIAIRTFRKNKREKTEVMEKPRRLMSEGEFSEWLLKELTKAYLDARKGKRKTRDEAVFELNASENLVRMRDAIMKLVYKPGRGIAFITFRPVIREIFASPFRDRVIHHLLYNLNAEWWDRRLIYKSGSCRKSKGTLFMVERLTKDICGASNRYQRETYVIKMDIQGYFMSLIRKLLFKRVVWGLKRQYPKRGREYKLCYFLWYEVIFDDPVKGVKFRRPFRNWRKLPLSKTLVGQPEGRGIVIGNLTSQLLSNIFLDQLDRFVTFGLGYKRYGRYVDDFYLVVSRKDLGKAKNDIRRIRLFLRMIGLKLHPRKIKIQEIHRGVDFMGMVIYPGRIIPGKRLVRNFRKAAKGYVFGTVRREVVVSYLGHLKHCKHAKLIAETFGEMGVKLVGDLRKMDVLETMKVIEKGVGVLVRGE